MIVGLDHVRVARAPGCVDAARAFCGALLGLAEIEKPPALARGGGVWFQVGDHELHVRVNSKLVAPDPHGVFT